MPKTQLFNIKIKKLQRRNLRQQDIACEKIVWHKLRNRGLNGLKFKRQYSIGNYIIDFFCPELKIGIEIDGATHSTPAETEYDRQRQSHIEKFNIKIIRYTNADIKENLSEVMHDLYLKCRKREIKPTSP
jgi:very-short-patch-repair endonuclease